MTYLGLKAKHSATYKNFPCKIWKHRKKTSTQCIPTGEDLSGDQEQELKSKYFLILLSSVSLHHHIAHHTEPSLTEVTLQVHLSMLHLKDSVHLPH